MFLVMIVALFSLQKLNLNLVVYRDQTSINMVDDVRVSV